MRLGTGPTPVRRLAHLGDGRTQIWLKDDGLYGDGPWGGNKVRKLEWLIADARRRGARTILTFGGLGTNHGLATALYAREQGLRTAIALVDQPVDDHVRAQQERLRRSGATLHYTRSKRRTVAALPWLVLRHFGGGRPPYVLPTGGSTAVGILGYVEAALELAAQVRDGELPEPSHVVTAVGTGGTAAGLVLGLWLAGLSTRVVGIVVNDQLRLDVSTVTRLAVRGGRLLRSRGGELAPGEPSTAAVTMPRGWLGPGYGHATAAGRSAQALLAQHEGVALDPVYTAKAMAGLLAIARDGRFGRGPILFLRTDGPR